ncbi:MAG: type II toxin-antitoxin system prevent-host-death family antitoxin [Nocardioides sp.]|jgi:prevent-host-death family protein
MTMSFSQARAELAAVLDRVSAGEEITITRHGEPVAVLVRPDRLRPRVDWVFEEASRFRAEFEAAEPAPGSVGGLDEDRAAALLSDLRTGRAAR